MKKQVTNEVIVCDFCPEENQLYAYGKKCFICKKDLCKYHATEIQLGTIEQYVKSKDICLCPEHSLLIGKTIHNIDKVGKVIHSMDKFESLMNDLVRINKEIKENTDSDLSSFYEAVDFMSIFDNNSDIIKEFENNVEG